MKMLFLASLLLFPVASLADDGVHLQVGLGFHDPAYDWHIPSQDVTPPESVNDAYGSNPLGIVRLSWQKGPWSVGYEHVSSIPNKRDDHGLNVVFVTVNVF